MVKTARCPLHGDLRTGKGAHLTRTGKAALTSQRRNDPPQIDPDGVVAIDRLLAFLQDMGVEVFLAYPPFNPIYYDAVQGSPYMEGLERVKAVTRELAEKYGLHIIGSFNPHDLVFRRI